MIESIDIMWLMPDWINIKLWENMYTVYMDKWKYVLNEQLTEYLEVDNVEIYVNDKLFDTIDRRIALRAGDTLHLEYSIHAEQ
jgi:hypothetical protein